MSRYSVRTGCQRRFHPDKLPPYFLVKLFPAFSGRPRRVRGADPRDTRTVHFDGGFRRFGRTSPQEWQKPMETKRLKKDLLFIRNSPQRYQQATSQFGGRQRKPPQHNPLIAPPSAEASVRKAARFTFSRLQDVKTQKIIESLICDLSLK